MGNPIRVSLVVGAILVELFLQCLGEVVGNQIRASKAVEAILEE